MSCLSFAQDDARGSKAKAIENIEEGVKRAKASGSLADLVLHIIDDSHAIDIDTDWIPQSTPIIKVFNKADLTKRALGRFKDEQRRNCVALSAATRDGLDELASRVKTIENSLPIVKEFEFFFFFGRKVYITKQPRQAGS